jgi:hypothetical protein
MVSIVKCSIHTGSTCTHGGAVELMPKRVVELKYVVFHDKASFSTGKTRFDNMSIFYPPRII